MQLMTVLLLGNVVQKVALCIITWLLNDPLTLHLHTFQVVWELNMEQQKNVSEEWVTSILILLDPHPLYYVLNDKVEPATFRWQVHLLNSLPMTPQEHYLTQFNNNRSAYLDLSSSWNKPEPMQFSYHTTSFKCHLVWPCMKTRRFILTATLECFCFSNDSPVFELSVRFCQSPMLETITTTDVVLSLIVLCF